jgi:hypothetical protein
MSPVTHSRKEEFIHRVHNPSFTNDLSICYLVTTTVPDRIEKFRQQVGDLQIHFTECLAYCGEDIDIRVLDGRIFIIHEGSYLDLDRARLERNVSRPAFSATLDKALEPLTNLKQLVTYRTTTCGAKRFGKIYRLDC